MESIYKNKYLKYKNKYLTLKMQLGANNEYNIIKGIKSTSTGIKHLI
jgi:hypothetical protein